MVYFSATLNVKSCSTIDGKKHIMHADRSTLDQLALAIPMPCASTPPMTVAIYSAISEHIRENVTQESWQEQQRIVAIERYQWFLLLPALLLMCCANVNAKPKLDYHMRNALASVLIHCWSFTCLIFAAASWQAC